MAALGEQDDGPIAVINIIPFVDIVLVLLIVFMLTSSAIVKASLKVDLPKAASGGAEVPSTVNLVYTSTSELFINGELRGFDEAAELIKSAAAADPKVQAVIAADKVVPYGDVVRLIDLVKTNGISSFALNIERDAKALAR